jgi:hypothetical protein
MPSAYFARIRLKNASGTWSDWYEFIGNWFHVATHPIKVTTKNSSPFSNTILSWKQQHSAFLYFLSF